MVTFNVDKDNNIIADERIQLAEGIEAIKQDIKHLLLMFKTEYPFDLSMGLEWYGLGSKNNKPAITHAVSNRILEDKRIRNIQKIEVSFRGREMTINATLNTIAGVINV